MSSIDARIDVEITSASEVALPLMNGRYLSVNSEGVRWVGKRGQQEYLPFGVIVGADTTGPLINKPRSRFTRSSNKGESYTEDGPIVLRVAELYEPKRLLAPPPYEIERRLRVHEFICKCSLRMVEQAVMIIRLLTLGSARRARRVRVILNPHSGARVAEQIFETRIAPIFDFAGMRYDVTSTDHAGHAIEIGRAFNPRKYEGIMLISGDGTVQEFISGLLTRPDWRTLVRRVPICTVGCGTANALAVGLRTGNPEYAAQCVIKHFIRPLDAVLVSNGAGLRTIALCGVGWGIPADIAKDSEKTRWLGTLRYEYLKAKYGIAVMSGFRVHKASIAYSADVAMDDAVLAGYFARPLGPNVSRLPVPSLLNLAGSSNNNDPFYHLGKRNPPMITQSGKKYAAENQGVLGTHTILNDVGDIDLHLRGGLEKTSEWTGHIDMMAAEGGTIQDNALPMRDGIESHLSSAGHTTAAGTGIGGGRRSRTDSASSLISMSSRTHRGSSESKKGEGEIPTTTLRAYEQDRTRQEILKRRIHTEKKAQLRDRIAYLRVSRTALELYCRTDSDVVIKHAFAGKTVGNRNYVLDDTNIGGKSQDHHGDANASSLTSSRDASRVHSADGGNSGYGSFGATASGGSVGPHNGSISSHQHTSGNDTASMNEGHSGINMNGLSIGDLSASRLDSGISVISTAPAAIIKELRALELEDRRLNKPPSTLRRLFMSKAHRAELDAKSNERARTREERALERAARALVTAELSRGVDQQYLESAAAKEEIDRETVLFMQKMKAIKIEEQIIDNDLNNAGLNEKEAKQGKKHRPGKTHGGSLALAGKGGFGTLSQCQRRCNVCRAQGTLRYIGHWRDECVLLPFPPASPKKVSHSDGNIRTEFERFQGSQRSYAVDMGNAHLIHSRYGGMQVASNRLAQGLEHKYDHVPAADSTESGLQNSTKNPPTKQTPLTRPEGMKRLVLLNDERTYSTEGSWATPLPRNPTASPRSTVTKYTPRALAAANLSTSNQKNNTSSAFPFPDKTETTALLSSGRANPDSVSVQVNPSPTVASRSGTDSTPVRFQGNPAVSLNPTDVMPATGAVGRYGRLVDSHGVPLDADRPDKHERWDEKRGFDTGGTVTESERSRILKERAERRSRYEQLEASRAPDASGRGGDSSRAEATSTGVMEAIREKESPLLFSFDDRRNASGMRQPDVESSDEDYEDSHQADDDSKLRQSVTNSAAGNDAMNQTEYSEGEDEDEFANYEEYRFGAPMKEPNTRNYTRKDDYGVHHALYKLYQEAPRRGSSAGAEQSGHSRAFTLSSGLAHSLGLSWPRRKSGQNDDITAVSKTGPFPHVWQPLGLTDTELAIASAHAHQLRPSAYQNLDVSGIRVEENQGEEASAQIAGEKSSSSEYASNAFSGQSVANSTSQKRGSSAANTDVVNRTFMLANSDTAQIGSQSPGTATVNEFTADVVNEMYPSPLPPVSTGEGQESAKDTKAHQGVPGWTDNELDTKGNKGRHFNFLIPGNRNISGEDTSQPQPLDLRGTDVDGNEVGHGHFSANSGFLKMKEFGSYVAVGAVTCGRDGPFLHASDGYLDLIIARHGSIRRTIGLLLRYVGKPCGTDEKNSPLYDYIKARSVVLTPEDLEVPTCLNVDGEVLPGPGPFRMHLMPSLLTAYGEN